jgi:hypothetical protein
MQVCDTVGELAAGIFEDGKWPERTLTLTLTLNPKP